MCGIIGAIGQKDVITSLIQGLRKLEYRGYDSSGIATIRDTGFISRVRSVGKVSQLAHVLETQPIFGHIGIAHTRWATHGQPLEKNAHPHISKDRFALIHNGIIENHQDLKYFLEKHSYRFESETDTEVAAHLIHYYVTQENISLVQSVQKFHQKATGSYSFAVLDAQNPQHLIVSQAGSPLVIGFGENEYWVASDPIAFSSVNQITFLEKGDVAELTNTQVKIYDKNKKLVSRTLQQHSLQPENIKKETYQHYMLQEIHEQPKAINRTLEHYLTGNQLDLSLLGENADKIFQKTRAVQISACGTSYHAALIAKYWIEDIVNIPCFVEIASEYRYRNHFTPENCLFLSLSQSGETADTLAALKKSKQHSYLANLSICNVEKSSIVRDSDLSLITQAGCEIGVASTKSFTTQLVALLLITHALGKKHKVASKNIETIISALQTLPEYIESAFKIEPKIREISREFIDKNHCLFLGRRLQYPIAMEGALKLKEISYIHAEAYAAGELKHGPLALVDQGMPVVVTLPSDNLIEKMQSNIEEVRSRGGSLYIFTDQNSPLKTNSNTRIFPMTPPPHELVAPIFYTIPLQLLSYYIAVEKGTDVDQPRNLAKSVTVE